ncbi:MAG: hypothetical protein B7Y36_04300 [Novosphingobium sp. 28-62-57]|nr:MAG: hypothetical protein B7Y36_04300 [Novosphingobium sp. 28-62-57]
MGQGWPPHGTSLGRTPKHTESPASFETGLRHLADMRLAKMQGVFLYLLSPPPLARRGGGVVLTRSVIQCRSTTPNPLL